MKSEIIGLSELYFTAFKNKNIELLKNLYSEDVQLIDWTGQWYGIESVLKSNEDLFQLEYELQVDETNIIQNKSYNSLQIRFEEGPIDILDVLYFDDKNKIIKIRAYKG